MNSDSSKLLVDEPPLILLPSLAVAIGLNEAILVQQVHYWLSNPKVGIQHNGRKWIWNTFEQWEEQFPFWSARTIKRVTASARDKGILSIERLDSSSSNQTNYYSLDYDALALIFTQSDNLSPSIVTDCHHHKSDNLTLSYISTETTTETTNTETTGNDSKESGTLDAVTSESDVMTQKAFKQSTQKKRKPRLSAKQINSDDYPFTRWALIKLKEQLDKHEENGGTHNFAYNRNGQLTIADEHLVIIEDNLSELARTLEINGNAVVDLLVNIYNNRFRHRDSCNLAILAGVNMGKESSYGEFTPEEYANWVVEYACE